MKKLLISLSVVIILVSLGCRIFRPKEVDRVGKVELPQEIIDNDWDKALTLSKEKNKPIYIEFYAKWCGYCKKFKAKTLNDEEVKYYLSKNYIPVVIDIEEGKGIELKSKYNINSFPTHLIVNVDETKKAENYGNMPPADFLAWIKSVK